MDNNIEVKQEKKKNKKNKIMFILSILFIFLAGVLFAFSFFNKKEKITYIIPESDLTVGDSYDVDAKYKDKKLNYISETPLIIEVNKETGTVVARSEGNGVIKIYVKDDPSIYEYVDIKVGPDKSLEEKSDKQEEQEEKPIEEQTNNQTDIKSDNKEKENNKQPQQTKPEQNKKENNKQPQQTKPEQNQKVQEQTEPKVIKVTGVEFKSSESIVEINNTIKLSAKVLPSNATDKTLIWSSSNNEIATVDESGKVRGISAGIVNITVTSKDGEFKKSLQVTVMNPVYVTELTSTDSKFYLVEGETRKINIAVVPNDATNKTVMWTSSNPRIATVDQNGVVKGISAGTVMIIAKAMDKQQIGKGFVVEILPTNGTVKFEFVKNHSYPSHSLHSVGNYSSGYYCYEGQQFDVLLTAVSGKEVEMLGVKSFSSSKTNVATIAKSKLQPECIGCKMVTITCKKKGTSKITATNSLDGKNIIKVDVYEKNETIVIVQPS